MSKKNRGSLLERGHHTAQEYLSHCRQHEMYAGETQEGSHVKVHSKNGAPPVIIPNHRGSIPTGTEHSIRKQMRLAGFLVLVYVATAILILL
ncbi:MAG: type II toxin-antitoxin system HicA family toxin [Chloroflexi bacterium]|nr:type II toxin-antitoxin system HicA family toxin [Chloroflexota bacterium]